MTLYQTRPQHVHAAQASELLYRYIPGWVGDAIKDGRVVVYKDLNVVKLLTPTGSHTLGPEDWLVMTYESKELIKVRARDFEREYQEAPW